MNFDIDLYAPFIGNANYIETVWTIAWLAAFVWSFLNFRQAREWALATRAAVVPNIGAIGLSGNSYFIHRRLSIFAGAATLAGALSMLQPNSECRATLGFGGWLILALLVGGALMFADTTRGIRKRQAETKRQLDEERAERRCVRRVETA